MSKQMCGRVISGNGRCCKQENRVCDRKTGVGEAGLGEVVRKGFLEAVTLKPKDEEEAFS